MCGLKFRIKKSLVLVRKYSVLKIVGQTTCVVYHSIFEVLGVLTVIVGQDVTNY